MVFNLALISKYRTELMGFAAIAILLCHAPANNVHLPSILSAVLARGGWGVDMFLVLSGIGIWYSLENSLSKQTIISWYRTRFLRIYIPYVIIVLSLDIIKVICYNIPFKELLLDLTTLNFWIYHSGAWFVSLMLPIYLIAPFIYKLLRSNNVQRLCVTLFLCIVCIWLSLVELGWLNSSSKEIVQNIQFAVARFPSFIIGMYMAVYIKHSAKLKYPIIFSIVLFIMAISLKLVFPKFTISSVAIVPVMFLVSMLIHHSSFVIRNVLTFFGKISLESYLFNIYLPFFVIGIPMHILGIDISYGNWIPYLLVLVIGTLLSIAVHSISIGLINKLK